MRIRALAVAPLLLLALAGCAPAAAGAPDPDQPPRNGESIKPGPEVVADAAAELLHAGSATVEGHLTADGADQRVSFDLQGSDLTGTVITRGQRVQIIVSDGETY